MQTLHGIDISMSYGLNYLRLCYFSFQRETSLFLECGWQTLTLFYGEVSLCLGLKPFLFHQLSWWFFFTQVLNSKAVVQAKLHNGLFVMAIPHNSKCRYGERGTADAKPKAQIILDAAKVSTASGGNSEPKQGQRSQSARGFYPRSTMRVPQPDIIEHFGNTDVVPQPPKRCLSR